MKLTKIGDFLKRSKIPIDILDNEEYKRVTIRINHNGVSLRDTEIGKKIGTKKQFILKSGQFIVSKIDARYGAFGIAPDEVNDAIITGNFWAYDVDFSKLNIEWFNQFTNSPDFYDLCERASAGITHRKYLNESFFLNYEIILPSVEEQLIQIDKIKLQKVSFGHLNSELTHQLDLIKQLRQAFLREAMQGKLVRSSELGVRSESGHELLAKIKAEKAKLIAEKKIKQGKLQEAEVLEDLLFDIPEHWVWCNLDDICFNITDGTHQTPQYTKTGRMFLSAQNVKPFKFMPENHKFVSEEDYQVYIKNRKPEKGDLLIGRVGAGIGETAVIDQDLDFCIYVSVALVQPFKEYINSDYLAQVFNSPYGVRYAKGNISSKGGSAGNFNLGRIRSFQIPLPPLHEQEQIVAKLLELMAFCDGLEQSIKESQGYNEKLLQQVLREALQSN
jgi:type I restriction enzyme S subunit